MSDIKVQPQWKTTHAETGSTLELENPGEEFIGFFINGEHVEAPTEDGPSKFVVLHFVGFEDNKSYQMNAGHKLEQAFSSMENGTLVRIIRTPDIDTGQESPMKDYRVDVAV